jgi:hypothetical protein
MKKLKLTRYADPGHSWLKVPRELIRALGIEEKISSCSYQLGDFAYLEEDCDMSVFFKALLKTEDISYNLIKESVDIVTKHTNRQSKVRTYPNYVPNFKRVEWVVGKKVRLYGKEYMMGVTIEGTKILYDGALRKYKVTNMNLDEMVSVDN